MSQTIHIPAENDDRETMLSCARCGWSGKLGQSRILLNICCMCPQCHNQLVKKLPETRPLDAR